MRNLIAGLALAVMFLAPPAAAQIVQPKPYDPAIVRVAGRAELYLPPDQARLSLSFYGPGKTAAEATDAAAKRARALDAAIKQIAPGKAKFERSDVRVSPVMSGGGDRRPDKIKGYEANAAITILVDDLQALSKVVEAAVNSEPDRFDDISYAVRDTAAARRKAREAAVKDAVDKARTYTEGAGFRLGRLLLVEEGGDSIIAQTGNRAVYRAAPMAAPAAPIEAPPIAPENQLYTAEVTLVYEIGAVIGAR